MKSAAGLQPLYKCCTQVHDVWQCVKLDLYVLGAMCVCKPSRAWWSWHHQRGIAAALQLPM